MRLTDFFMRNRSISGLFLDTGITKRDGAEAFSNIKTDYVLSRSLYSSAPSSNSGYLDYALGNYCTKLYIDTFCWFIGLPDIQAESDTFSKAIQAFLTRNKTLLFNIYKQTMVDGKHYVWIRLEQTAMGKSEIRIKQIPLELVGEDDCIKDLSGGYLGTAKNVSFLAVFLKLICDVLR